LNLTAGSILHRFYSSKKDPIYFDRSTDGRFNAPSGNYGVLYAAREDYGAFAETFLRRPGATLIDDDLLVRKAYVRLETTSDLLLIKFGGSGLAKLGATAEVVHGGLPYDIPQAWSQALFDHPLCAQGIAYYARHDDEALCYAIFERASPYVIENERRLDLDHDWFWRLAVKYGVGMAPM
jgi:hypothetical protein